MQKRITIKIGSNVLTAKDGSLDLQRLAHLTEQISTIRKEGYEVILISSGAVASGRSMISPDHKLDIVSQRQLFASIGQVRLMSIYSELFEYHNISCAQVLVTKEDFRTRRHYLNIQNCINALLQNGVLPVINENDVVSVSELMFTDNDELSGLISAMMHAKSLFLLSNIDGIYNGDPTDLTTEIIPVIDKNILNIDDIISTKKSNFGRGGMLTKYSMARKAAQSGITVYIANGKRDHIITSILQDESKVPHTKFIASKKQADSNIKQWIHYSEGFAKGKVYINKGAADAILSSKASSLLFIGITAIKGEFKKDDVIKIYDHKKQQIGVGKSQFDSDAAIENIGKKGIKPFIHYDYLYLSNE